MQQHKSSVLTSLSEGRRRNMAAIRSKDTKPEIFVRRRVHSAGFRYRLHRRDLPGRPDLVFTRFKLAVFVHGCFWHGHECSRSNKPKTNASYWGPKIRGNVERDLRNAELLRRERWTVFAIRECTIEQDTEALVEKLTALRVVEGKRLC